MQTLKSDGDMRHTVQNRVIDRANALGSRVLCVLFAIVALCATPLGTGELLAAKSHVYERQGGEIRHGDLPQRFAMPTDLSQVFETVERASDATLAAATCDDTPDEIVAPAPLGAGDLGETAAVKPPAGLRGGHEAGFNARAPPRA